MKRMHLVSTLAAGLCLTGLAIAQSSAPVTINPPDVASAPASAPADDARAVDLIKRACEKLTAAKSFETTCRFTRLMGTKKDGELLELRARMLYAAKDRLRIVSDPPRFSVAGNPSEGNRGLSITSIFDDGKSLYFVMPDLKRYAKRDAPAKATEIFEKGELPPGANFPGMTAFPAFLRDDPFKLMTVPSRRSVYTGKEKLDGVECHVIRQQPVESEQLIDLKIWVQADAPIFRQFKTDFSRAEARGMQLLEPEIAIHFDEWSFDVPVAAADFAYTPPADYRQTETFFIDPSEMAAASGPSSAPASQPSTP